MPRIVKQRLTISLTPQTLQKAKLLAAKRSLPVSRFLAEQIGTLVAADEAYDRAHRAALDLMERGFPMGGVHSIDRYELHSRDGRRIE